MSDYTITQPQHNGHPHPVDDDVNRHLLGSPAADKFFKPGAVLGSLGTLLGSATAVYVVGRVKD